MKKINYKSDFDFVAKLTATNANGESVEVGFPDYDFELIITSGCNGYSTRSFVASSIGGVTKNCYNDNGKIHIICDNHKLSAGQLHMEFRSFLPNSNYPDGTQKVVATYDLDIELTTENTGITSAEVQIVLPFLYDSVYRIAQQGGYKGTQEEYYQLASQLPNAVETANKVQASADSLANSAEQIGGAIETLASTTETIEQGANAIKDNADTLAESATIVKTSAEQIGANIENLQASVSSIDGAVEGINQGASTITNSATKVETSATTLEGVSATINGSATSLADSATAIAEGANIIKGSADALQENVGKVSESATKVEQAVEPLVQASESLNATKQAFEMLSSEWSDGRKAIATALSNRRYPTEASESFHAMADKITNMSYEEGWFAKIGYTDENNGGIKEAIDYSYELAKGWNPDGGTLSLFTGDGRLLFAPVIDCNKYYKLSSLYSNCGTLLIVPDIYAPIASSISSIFLNCRSLVYVGEIYTPNVSVDGFNGIFNQCSQLLKVKRIYFGQVSRLSLGYATTKLSFLEGRGLGTHPDLTTATFLLQNWGVETIPNARQSVIDTLITYSFDRAAAGYAPCSISLSSNTKEILTEEEIAQITAKGFTIA